MENGHIVEQGMLSCFTHPQTDAFKTIFHIDVFRGNDDEKSTDCRPARRHEPSASAAQTIRFATEASYPPFELVDANNQIVGFDVDLANALCKEIDATCTFTNQAFDSLIPGLKFRRSDAVMAGMDITPEREKQVLFSDPHMTTRRCSSASRVSSPALTS